MRDARIGRVLVASLHQAIAEVLPARLEFYENWLNSSGLRHGTIGLPSLAAVLSFLRHEGDAYLETTSRAGRYAAEWTLQGLPPWKRTMTQAAPLWLRARIVLRLARQMVGATYPGSRAIGRLRRGAAVFDIRGSLFCEVRDAAPYPLCGFYAAALTRLFELFGVEVETEVSACRAVGSGGCHVALAVLPARLERNRVVAA